MDGSPLSLWKVGFCEDVVESLRSSGYGKKEGGTWLLVLKTMGLLCPALRVTIKVFRYSLEPLSVTESSS